MESGQRSFMRIASEAKDKGGLLSQEVLGELLMCYVRKIRKHVQTLRK